MPLQLPNPLESARREAETIIANREYYLQAPLDRVLADASFVDRQSLLAGLDDFHRERMQRIPSFTKYPEAKPWTEFRLTADRELQRLTGMSDREMAIYRSLHAYITFRGFAAAKPAQIEKCRVAYLPESDHGQIHLKNVDDPATYWKTLEPPPTSMPLSGNLIEDGVGSGLHIDDEPEEIFPIDARTMRPHYADDVPGAIEFYTRYKSLWGGGNIVLHDHQKRSAAIEKCSYNFIEIFYPGSDGRSHCSGMACRDATSPQGRYQRAKRQQYLRAFGQPSDGPDQSFWDACDRAERMLSNGVKNLGKIARLDDIVRLFRTAWPAGLNKDGIKCHPKQSVSEYTLVIRCYLPDRNRFLRWQRDPQTLKLPEEPEVFQF